MVVSRDNRAFTLVEILIVIAIIALLATLLFPAFARVKEQGRQGTCLSKLHTLQQAIKQYFLDHGEYPRTGTDLQKYMDVQLDTTNGLFIAGKDNLTCLDDFRVSSNPQGLYSSYTGFAQNPRAPLPTEVNDCNGSNPEDHPENCPVATSPSFGIFDPANPGQSSALPNTFQRLVNYWGYDIDGTALCRGGSGPCASKQSPYSLYLTSLRLGIPPPPLPVGISGWANYPALANVAAPDNTIITHCWFHRPITGAWTGGTWNSASMEVILRLGGDARVVRANSMDERPDTTMLPQVTMNPTKWVRQSD